MAWTTITYTCGHEDEIQLYGPGRERERKQAAMEAHECPECRARHATERDEAEGYAALTGSPKQVAWASDIRRNLVERIQRLCAGKHADGERFVAEGKVSEAEMQQMLDKIDGIVDKTIGGIRAETSARWLIDNQHASTDDLCDRYAA